RVAAHRRLRQRRRPRASVDPEHGDGGRAPSPGARAHRRAAGAHASLDAARAAALITRGEWKTPFWGGVIAAGTALPIVLVWPTPYSAALGGALALAGLWIYEDLWVKAGQSGPLS